MSSTREAAEAAAAEFYDRVLAPLGRQLQAEGAALADVAPRRSAESFYEAEAPFGKAEFELAAGAESAVLLASLLAQWRNEPALHPLAEKVVALSAKVGADVELSSEVSAFVYVMF